MKYQSFPCGQLPAAGLCPCIRSQQLSSRVSPAPHSPRQLYRDERMKEGRGRREKDRAEERYEKKSKEERKEGGRKRKKGGRKEGGRERREGGRRGEQKEELLTMPSCTTTDINSE